MKSLIYTLAIAVILFSYKTSLAQWIQTNGPAGANVLSLESDGSRLYAAVESNGILFTGDHGSNWSEIGYHGCGVNALAAEGSLLFAMIGDYVVKTTNLGNNWNTCAVIPDGNCLMVQDSVLVAGTFGNGVFVSTDNGNSWSSRNNGLPSLYVADVDIDSGFIYVILSYHWGIYRSSDYGESWTYIGFEGYWDPELDVINHSLYVSYVSPASVMVSHDRGSSWTEINNGISGKIHEFESDGYYIFASGNMGMFRSSNGGEYWELCEPNMLDFLSLTSLGSEVYCGAYRSMLGIYKTTDNGNTWNSTLRGFIIPVIVDIGYSGGALFAGLQSGGVKYTSNSGYDWEAAGMEYGFPITGLAANINNIYVSTVWDQAGLYRSSDRGANWLHIGNSEVFDIAAFAVTNDRVYVSTRNFMNPGLYMSSNDGLSWNRIGNLYYAACLYASLNELIVSSAYHGMQMTTDYGANWTSMNNGTPVSYAGSIIGKGNLIFASFGNHGVYVTGNHGMSWIAVNNGLSVLNVRCFAVLNDKLFAGTSDGVFVTTDDGVNWSDISEGLLYRNVSSLEAVNGFLFAATLNGGVWRLPIEEPLPVELAGFYAVVSRSDVLLEWLTLSEMNNSGFDIERSLATEILWSKIGFVNGNGTASQISKYSFNDKNPGNGSYRYRLKQIDFNGNFEYFELPEAVNVGVPDKYFIDQNYPNPFNPHTVIQYGIPYAGNVTLKIFDMAGREIRTLVNESRKAGFYSERFDGSSLSSGTYIYRIESGSFVSARKMILFK
ncbi:MAG: T9SS type A sorting domain-containing protein [Ignavibacteria bacterium]|nr:T9SS type A sorting domain-containing protein [Ignavibacteria bacterium]